MLMLCLSIRKAIASPVRLDKIVKIVQAIQKQPGQKPTCSV